MKQTVKTPSDPSWNPLLLPHCWMVEKLNHHSEVRSMDINVTATNERCVAISSAIVPLTSNCLSTRVRSEPHHRNSAVSTLKYKQRMNDKRIEKLTDATGTVAKMKVPKIRKRLDTFRVSLLVVVFH